MGARVEEPRGAACPCGPFPRAVDELAVDDPADHHRAEAVLFEHSGNVGDDLLGDAVAAEPRVPKHEVALGGDDVRRVRDDEVETLALDGLEEAALAQLDVLDPVHGQVELGERQRSLADVRRDDPLGVPRGEDRLDPAAGADVERARDRPPHGQAGEHGRGRLYARHVK